MSSIRRRMRVLVGLLLAALVCMLASAAALRHEGGGIHGQSLSPAVLALMLGGVGALILLHRPEVLIGQLAFWNGLGSAVGTLAAAVLDYGVVHPIPRLAAQAAFATVWLSVALIPAWTLFVLWFPDGRFTSRGWRRYFALTTTLCAAVALGGWLAGPADALSSFYGRTAVPPGAAGPFAGAMPWLARGSTLLLLVPLAALAALVQRYRRDRAVVREQVRWLLVAMSVQIPAQIGGAALFSLAGLAHDLGVALSVLSQPLPVVAATAAILRYRLWEIDLVVSRAAVYGALWAALSGLLLVPALAAGLLVGGRGALAAVGIALLVTAVFQPTRRRLERLAERLVYRHRTTPHVLLTGFWETLRTTDLERLGPLVAHAVHGGLAVEWAGMWLYAGSERGGSLRPLGTSGMPAGPAAPVSPAGAAELLASPGLVLADPPAADLAALWPGPPAAVVPLVAGDELVGLIACGARRGNPLAARDFELLELLGRNAGLRLRNLRLEAQLRDRLAEIETQAEELRLSRQRLVSAQDEERRRIERDLHDGVQQQLVSLAVRLRRLADDGRPPLADLAVEAEQAIFALQELARGIFPGVLADQGLIAALRTQAARMPLAVRIDADPELGGRRLDPETEAALYFVALEALTNVQKHAPGASALVRVRHEDDRVVLEVVDDGPGLAHRGRGAGLQNMADRVAAAGGMLALEPGRDGGTRVVASAPAGTPAQAPLADSRR